MAYKIILDAVMAGKIRELFIKSVKKKTII